MLTTEMKKIADRYLEAYKTDLKTDFAILKEYSGIPFLWMVWKNGTFMIPFFKPDDPFYPPAGTEKRYCLGMANREHILHDLFGTVRTMGDCWGYPIHFFYGHDNTLTEITQSKAAFYAEDYIKLTTQYWNAPYNERLKMRGELC